MHHLYYHSNVIADLSNFVVSTAGVIDRDYRGNVGVVMFNLGQEDYHGEKITIFVMWYASKLLFVG